MWLDRFHESGLGNITAQSIPVRGLSMLFPEVHCIKDGSICQLTVGEGEINAAASIMAFFLSDKFDLRNTYFVLGGIAGVNPRHATLGSVAFSRYAVQVALQYELDSRSIPDTWHTGYIPYGRESPFEYPTTTYGTEVFELNDNLRHLAYKFASRGKLQDANGPQQYRARYLATGNTYKQATQPPTVLKCDTATSEVYYSGKLLSEAFENTTRIWTNGTGVYCMSAQEDNAILEGLVRGTIAGLVDFSRVILYRAGSYYRTATCNLRETKKKANLSVLPYQAPTSIALLLASLTMSISSARIKTDLKLPSTTPITLPLKLFTESWLAGTAHSRVVSSPPTILVISLEVSAAIRISAWEASQTVKALSFMLQKATDQRWRGVRWDADAS